jgi:hypothetical protein
MQSEKAIVEQLKESGYSQEEINSFLAKLPAFEDGGSVPETGPAILHKGEFVIPANQVQEIRDQIKLWSDIFAANNPTVQGTDTITREFTSFVLEKEAQKIEQDNQISIQFGDIIINIPNGANNPTEIAAMVKNELNGFMLNSVQRAVDQNKLDIRGKRT